MSRYPPKKPAAKKAAGKKKAAPKKAAAKPAKTIARRRKTSEADAARISAASLYEEVEATARRRGPLVIRDVEASALAPRGYSVPPQGLHARLAAWLGRIFRRLVGSKSAE